MSENHSITVYSQPSLIMPKDRTLDIYFSVPDNGVNSETGILLIIAGYGGNSNSKVYKKMREQFANQFNLVTVQCDYFGCEFMQSIKNFTLTPELLDTVLSSKDTDRFIANPQKYSYLLSDKIITYKVPLQETLSNYNDMGIVQAMDNIIALKVVIDILNNNNYIFNHKKCICYGFSHGGYIAYLCNRFMPKLFSSIIDNCAYIFPTYISDMRTISSPITDNSYILFIYDYLAKNISCDYDIYKLTALYSDFCNKASIICYLANEDKLAPLEIKQPFIDSINNAHYEIIDESRVDNIIFKSTRHGLDADFIKLFEYTAEKYKLDSTTDVCIFSDCTINTAKYSYIISNDMEIPIMIRKRL